MTSPDERCATDLLAPPLNPLLTSGAEYPFVTLERRRRELTPAGVEPIAPPSCAACLGGP